MKTIKKENTVQETIKPMMYDALLSTELVRTLVEATGRFEFVEETAQEIVFFDNHWEQNKAIGTKWTLKQIMGWITNYYAEDYQWQGEEKAKLKIRRALGIDD